MPPPPTEAQRRLAAWWAGSRQEPIVVPAEDAPCVCESLLPRGLDDLRLHLRIALMTLSNHAPSSFLKVQLARMAGVRIAARAYLSPCVLLDPLYPQLIAIEEGALLGIGARLVAHEYTATEFRLGSIRVGGGAVVGAFSTVRSGVSIGRRATVGMHSLVVRDVPDGVTVAGVPATRTISERILD